MTRYLDKSDFWGYMTEPAQIRDMGRIELSECFLCGAAVLDRRQHENWHAEIEPSIELYR